MAAVARPVTNEAVLLRRVLEPGKPFLTPAAAKAIVGLDFPDDDKARLKELAGKARAGGLSAAEQQEVEAYGRVGSLLSILRAKARKTLAGLKPKAR
ncbi:MAG: hypothetical protein JWO38_969 [Gemmataceae bacterium]|nr:hypothetical protein [Gemmataceae bacterium]